MYINKFHAKIQDDGCLFFHDPDDHLKKYIISPWKDALKTWVIDPKELNYRKTTYQNLPDITLLTEPHLSKTDHPVNHFIQQIPYEVIDRCKNFLHLQFHILRTVAHCSYAYDLLLANPNLLAFKLLVVRDFEDWLYNFSDQDLSISQVSLLTDICSRRVSNSEIKILKKIKMNNGDMPELDAIYLFFMDYEYSCKQLQHMAVIPINFIETINENPDFIVSPFYIHLSRSSLTGLNLSEKFERACNLQKHIQQMRYLEKPDLSEPLSRIKTYQQLKRLHDRIVEDYNKYRKRTEFNLTFLKPPIPGVPGIIEPIVDSNELQKEAQTQHNCVASFTPDAYNYFYRVLQPDDRCTLHIRYSHFDDEFFICEIKGKCNISAKSSTIDEVRDWLSQNQINKPQTDHIEQLYNNAAKFLLENKNISISLLQRKFRLGYNRAEQILKLMEMRDLISCVESEGYRTYSLNKQQSS